ncbi:MAG: SGNH/GDSL hydrolase family protein [Verrucomicrobiales bacterium]
MDGDLDSRRSADFDFGREQLYFDTRATGHEFNFAIPGYTTEDWRELLSGGGNFLEDLSRDEIRDQLQGDDVHLAIVFLGGNDINQEYQTYYNGADPAPFVASLLANWQNIINRLRGWNADIPMILTTAPDVGATPDVVGDHPDPAKRANVTALVEDLNAGLAAIAAADANMELADIYEFTKRYISPEPICIGGLEMIKGTHPENNTRYLFGADGFHPNTGGQAFIASEILRAANALGFGVAPLTPRETLQAVLGIDADLAYREWADAAQLPADRRGKFDDPDRDGIPNAAEYALGLDPIRPDAGALPQPLRLSEGGDEFLALRWSAPHPCRRDLIRAERSSALTGWQIAEDAEIVASPDGMTWTLRAPAQGEAGFLRMRFELPE